MALHRFRTEGIIGRHGCASSGMIHFTCDMCGKTLLLDEDARYIVRIEVWAAYDPMEITQADLAKDHARELKDLIEEMAHADPEKLQEQLYQTFRFDLCPACREKYLKDPLRPSMRRTPFGRN